MITNFNIADVYAWQDANNGSVINPKGHALKLLGEAIELCFVAGATSGEIKGVCNAEVDKATVDGELEGRYDKDYFPEEMADVAICLIILNRFLVKERGEGTMALSNAIEDKVGELRLRKYVPDADGVLRRPGRKNT
jgi:hypothetical protein